MVSKFFSNKIINKNIKQKHQIKMGLTLSPKLYVLLVILLTILVIGLFLYFAFHLNILEYTILPAKKSDIVASPKEDLIQYFVTNWAKLAPYIIRKDCDNENIPPEILADFKKKFGHYFKNKHEEHDPMLQHYSNNTYERTFKMEFTEMCKTLKALGDFMTTSPIRHQALSLKELGKEIERLHTEHFPQAVFISVILERMIDICNKYPEYNVDQIVNTHDLLTTTIIFYLVMPSKYW